MNFHGCGICQSSTLCVYVCKCGSGFCSDCYVCITDESPSARCPICDIRLSARPQASDQRLEDLSSTRVIQRKLIYVIGLAPEIADEATLRSEAYFGQYGGINKIVVNRSNPYNSPNGQSFSAYVNFKTEMAATLCIKAISGFYLQRELSATYGTTKYCSSFLKGHKCTKEQCQFLHELGSKIDSFTRATLQHGKHVQSHNSIFSRLNVTIESPKKGRVLPLARLNRPRSFTEDEFHSPVKPRLFSVDCKTSRFSFIEAGSEYITETPKYLEELVNGNSPAKKEATIPLKSASQLLMDPWVTDVIVLKEENGGYLITAA